MQPPRGIIIEGVSGVGKTRVIRSLRMRLADRWPGSTTLFLSEHYTERVLEDLRAQHLLTRAHVLDHLETEVMPLIEGIVRLQAASKFAGRGGNGLVRVLVERWIGGMFANLQADGVQLQGDDWPIRSRVDANLARLRDLGFRLVVLHVAPEYMAALVESTRQRRNAAWSDYLESIARNHHGDLAEYFACWQRSLSSYYRSAPLMEVAFIEVSPPLDDAQVDTVSDRILNMIDPAQPSR